MKIQFHQYAAIITRAYPNDIRIFIARILPFLKAQYNLPFDFDKKTELNRFDWGNMYNRCEDFTIGKQGFPAIRLLRNVSGNAEFTDEWESASLELIDFCPPQIADIIELKITCAESFLTTDKGSHQCEINFKTTNILIYNEVLTLLEKILKQFKNAHITIAS